MILNTPTVSSRRPENVNHPEGTVSRRGWGNRSSAGMRLASISRLRCRPTAEVDASTAERVDLLPPAPLDAEQLEALDRGRDRGIHHHPVAQRIQTEQRPDQEQRRTGGPCLRAA